MHMINFFKFPQEVHLLITFGLGLSVLFQSLALILNYYSQKINAKTLLKFILELAILGEILMFSLQHGQIVGGYQTGLVVPTGYDGVRVLFFVVCVTLSLAVSVQAKKVVQLSVVIAAAISLPVVENSLGSIYPWAFMAALLFFLARSISISIESITAFKNNISALSVRQAIDTLHTGVLFSETDGSILLCNQQMQKLMITMSGKIYRNGIRFYELLTSGGHLSTCQKIELDEHMVFLLPDATAWMVTKTDILMANKTYIHLSIADVSELWTLIEKLQYQELKLRQKSAELKETMQNLHVLSKKKEIEQAKMRAHDILGQRLSVLLRTIQTEKTQDVDILTTLSKGLLDELKAEQIHRKPEAELENIQQIFATVGVNITFEGEFPPNEEQARLFIDIIREGSTNAVRHGFATEINIKTEQIENNNNLTIKNNGLSITIPITPGSGIQLIKKKVVAYGGTIEITLKPLFTLSVVLPGGVNYA